MQSGMTRWTERECDVHAEAVKLEGELPSTPHEMHQAFTAAIDQARFQFITNNWNDIDVRDPNGVVQRVNVRRARDPGFVDLQVVGLSEPVREHVANGTFQHDSSDAVILHSDLQIFIAHNISQWIVLQLYLSLFLVCIG
jgi:tetrahydromethanopterin S-methyltransferase subunit A